MKIMVITFHSQADLLAVEKCVSDIENSGGLVHWTSFTQDTQVLETEVYLSDENDFSEKFALTDSFQNSNFS